MACQHYCMPGLLPIVIATQLEAGMPEPGEAEIAWIAAGQFCKPDTVLPLLDDTLLVSNVCNFRTRGNGFLTLLGADGKVIDWRIVDSLDAALGMALVEDRLYVVVTPVAGPLVRWGDLVEVLGGGGISSANHA